MRPEGEWASVEEVELVTDLVLLMPKDSPPSRTLFEGRLRKGFTKCQLNK